MTRPDSFKLFGRRRRYIGQRDMLPRGRPRWHIVSACVLLAAGLAAIAWEGLPGPTRDPITGLQGALHSARFLVITAIGATVGILCAARALRYRRLIEAPGPLNVLPLADGSEPATGSLAVAEPTRTHLDLQFRDRLSEARLEAPIAGGGNSTDLVELLETSKLDPTQPLFALGRALRIVRPTHGYEVRATLLRQDGPRPCGVVAEVAILPQRRTTLRTYWCSSWDQALDRAANGVIAQVIPRSRHSDSGVWCSWKGFVLDEKLLEVYQRAVRLQKQRRYEEALDQFFAAVRLDPSNGHLRLGVGVTQQTLALYLDALVTYQGIIGLPHSRALSRTSRRAMRRTVLIARYRHTVLLGYGEGLAEQWLPAPTEAPMSRRSVELHDLRQRLRPMVRERFAAMAVSLDDKRLLGVRGDTPRRLEALLDERPHVNRDADEGPDLSAQDRARRRQDNRRLRERRLHLLFQLLAEESVDRLVDGHAWYRRVKPGTDQTPLTHELLRSWAQLRTERARQLLRAERRRQDVARRTRGLPPGTARKLQPSIRHDSWPPSAEDVRALWASHSLARRSLRRRLDRSTHFVDHYNAACIYAIGLLPGPYLGPSDKQARLKARSRTDALARNAVSELQRGAEADDGSMLAKRWDSIVADDLDLAGLRQTPDFRRFEIETLPSARAAPARPGSIVRLTASRHSVQLTLLCARHVADIWRVRARGDEEVMAHEALAWWADEASAWSRAAELASHHRHWQTRLRVIEDLQAFAARSGAPAFHTSFPSYGAAPIAGDAATVERQARHEIHSGDVRLAALAETLNACAGAMPGMAAWEHYLRTLAATNQPLPSAERRRLAEDRAAVWRGMLEVFVPRSTTEEHQRESAARHFGELIARLETLAPPSHP